MISLRKPVKTLPYSIFFYLLLTFSNSANSVSIVSIEFSYNNASHFMDVELYDDITPATVANYLDYVVNTDSSGQPKYDATFIYRNVPGFILQTGGYTFRPPDPLVDALISPIVPQPVGLATVAKGPLSPVVNEPGLPNNRGTIAMAKIPAQFIEGGDCIEEGPNCTLVEGTGPDTATREWFINLSDNNELDTANGGFTVFGKIIDDGINIADEISTFPDRPYAGTVLGPSFNNLPVVNYDTDALPAVLQEHLVMITTITPINRPILRLSPDAVDFFLDVAGDGNNPVLSVTVKNTGDETLGIEPINTADLSPPFGIISDSCSNVTLDPVSITATDSCTIDYQFSPGVTGIYTDNITINYYSAPDATPYSVTVDLSGEGVPQQAVLSVAAETIQFEDTIVNETSQEITTAVMNKGGDPLLLGDISINGIDNNDFSITSTNCSINVTMAMGETCDIVIRFSPLIAGIKTAELIIQSNAGSATIPINGNAIIPEISVNPVFSIVAEIGNSRKKFLNVTNSGTSTLVINKATISGTDAQLFTQENNCPNTNNSPVDSASLEPGGTCRFLIEFTQSNDGGNKTATLTIESNDPINPSVTISLNGTGEKDTDGVPGTIETSAPNNGDANNDGIADETQNDVASLLSRNSEYITFISDSSLFFKEKTLLIDVTLLDSIPADIPANAEFTYGLYSHSISLPLGDGVNMAILLPANANPDKFYKFGPTPDNTTPHWYDFTYDETTGTGAKFLGTVTIQSPDGTGVQKNFVIITFFDGLKGDDDLIANGIILNSQSGISTKEPDSGSGAILWILFLIPLSILIYRRPSCS